jgi:hypothetical protein
MSHTRDTFASPYEQHHDRMPQTIIAEGASMRIAQRRMASPGGTRFEQGDFALHRRTREIVRITSTACGYYQYRGLRVHGDARQDVVHETLAKPTLRQLCNDFEALRSVMLRRMERTCRIGWVDHGPMSFDWRHAGARAYRVQQRIVFGRRLTTAEWRRELPF